MNQKSNYTVIFDECSCFCYLCEERTNGSKHYTMFDSVCKMVNYCNDNNICAMISNW